MHGILDRPVCVLVDLVSCLGFTLVEESVFRLGEHGAVSASLADGLQVFAKL